MEKSEVIGNEKLCDMKCLCEENIQEGVFL
jgi:hypothetical protein